MQEKIIISVYNKTGLVEFAKTLTSLWYEIIATEGTGKRLEDNNITFTPVQEITQNPPELNDCIQTISYRIPAGILFNRSNNKHVTEVENNRIVPIGIVVYNFPPIYKNVLKTSEFDIQHVDVWWPLMVRAAATNFRDVVVVVDPEDYTYIWELLSRNMMTIAERKKLAIKAFEYTKKYDQEIIHYLQENSF